MKIYKITLLIAMTAMLLLGCSNIEKPEESVGEQGATSFYSTNEIHIEDMGFNGVKFGDTRQEVVDKIGEPEGIEELYEAYCYEDYTISFTKQGFACLFTIMNEDFSPYKNIKKGDNILSALKKLPIPTTPDGIGAVYKEFTGDEVHDLNLLDEFFTTNIEDPDMPGEPNYYDRIISYYFDDNYILTFYYVSIKVTANDNINPGIIKFIKVQTADAPSFED